MGHVVDAYLVVQRGHIEELLGAITQDGKLDRGYSSPPMDTRNHA
jgi:hypothetical protein